MKKALVLIDDLFQDAEALYPYYRLQEAGFDVDLVGAEAAKEYKGKYGNPLKSDIAASDVNIKDYDAIIIPGGYAPDRMRRKPEMVNIVKAATEKGKVVAVICHGPWMLIEANVVRDKKVTCYFAIKTDVINAGGKYEDKEVVVDGKLVTSRKPSDLPAFMRETLKLLGK